MATRSIPRTLPEAPTEMKPTANFGTVSEGNQRAWKFEPADYLEWREVIYEALRGAVSEAYPGQQYLFAEAVGVSSGEASRRLKHAPDEKTGKPQQAYIDYLATLATMPGALEAFCSAVLRAKGCRVELDRPPTAEEVARGLAAEMTDKQKRRLEAEKGWPRGWLDR